MQKVTLAQKGSAFGIRQITSHLLHPLLRRVPGDAGQRHPSCFQLDDKQNIVRGQTSPGEYLGGEEVRACQNRHVGSDEVLQVVVWLRFGAGAIPCRRRTFPTV